MSAARSIELVALLLAQLLAGLALGVVYFESLRRTVGRFTTRRGWLEPLALTVGRIGMAVVAFAIAARFGATALLVTFVGFLIARTTAVHRSRGAG